MRKNHAFLLPYDRPNDQDESVSRNESSLSFVDFDSNDKIYPYPSTLKIVPFKIPFSTFRMIDLCVLV
jgi:hypothetical protein